MVIIQLAEDEATIVKRMLELFLSDLRMEIADTDSADFRMGLKDEKKAIQHAISQLEEQLLPDASPQ